MVESDWIELKCYKNLDTNNQVRLQVNRADTIVTVCRKLHEHFSVFESQLSRLWTTTLDEKLILLDLNKNVEEAGLYTNQVVLLEVESFGHWLPQSKIWEHIKKLNTLQIQKPEAVNSNQPMVNSELKRNIINLKSNYTNGKETEIDDASMKFTKVTLNICSGSKSRNAGVCGLINLGNTCYMNSVLQCLSNCRPLTEYFLRDSHLYEINKNNPLGMNGEIAKKYGELIKNMWSGDNYCLKPFQLKSQVCRFSTQFRGWTQHDAQEFLSFLLDGLHEDLKRVCRKPIEDKDGKSSDSEDILKTPFENHKLKNDSVIVDTFHGSLKSRVICPKCEKLSVTIDPFSTLSLPLPLQKSKKIKINFVPHEPSQTISSFIIGLPNKGLFKDLLAEVSHKTNTIENLLIPAEVTDYHIQRIYTQHDKLSILRDNEEIYVYELSEKSSRSEYSIIPVCFWNLKSSSDRICLKYGFGIPLLLTFLKSDLKAGKIGSCINDYIVNRFKLEEACAKEMFVLDLTHKRFADSVELEFNDDGECRNNIIDILELNNSNMIFVRKMLFVNVPLTGSESFFSGLTARPMSEVIESSKKHSEKLNIYDCIDMFTSFEKLGQDNAWYCPNCRSQQRATKKFDIWSAPKILILHLKRFSYSSLGDKLEIPIDFPVDGLNLSQYVANPSEKNSSYNLLGVINHYGTLSGGHYTASCRNFCSGSWNHFNDETVSSIEPQQVPSHSAYLLFYSRNDLET